MRQFLKKLLFWISFYAILFPVANVHAQNSESYTNYSIAVRSGLADVNRLADVLPRKIVVGVRSDASPFSYKTVSRVQEDVLSGYGGYMVEICRRVLAQMINNGPFAGFRIEAYDITAGNRFDYLNDGSVDMLCGPDSITLNRLRKHNASHPLFLSGLTYVSVSNDDIPRARYCSGVIGLVRRTTAESTGLQIIARSRELGRFHAPLESYLSFMSDPSAYTSHHVTSSEKNDRVSDERIAREVIADELLDFLPDMPATAGSEPIDQRDRIAQSKPSQAQATKEIPKHPGDLIESDQVETPECASGYDNGPVVFFDNHVEGLNALCAREILFYMGDFDIIRKRLNGMTDCQTVMRRETITDEAYGAYFRKFRGESANAIVRDIKSSYLDSLLYAEFNNVLLQKMQAAEGILDYEFQREFGDEQKTQDLQQFFDSFKFASHY